uniref:Preproprotein pGQ n=1 Tax=Xenopus tropicalis TaxID=8364 RepID=A0A803J9T6_XENTR
MLIFPNLSTCCRMLKGIFLCVLLAVLSANSMAQPVGSADADEMIEREVRGFMSKVANFAKKFAKGGVNAIMNQKREAMPVNSDDFNSAHSKRFIGALLRPALKLLAGK